MLSAILKKQAAAEDYLPRYGYHVTDTIVSLEDGRAMFTVRAKGIPFEATSDNLLENNYDSLNSFFLNIAKSTGSRLSIWSHLDHFQTHFKTNYKFSFEWMKKFSDKYMSRFAGTEIYENDFYLTFVLKPGANDTLDECVRELEEIQLFVNQNLRSYDCEILSMYEYEGNQFSQVYEFIGYLYNGFWERIPVTSLPMHQVVASSTLHHGYKLIETRFPDKGHRFSAFFDLKDFPEPTTRGKFNPLLELPFPFVLGLSFTFINTADSIKMINSALNKMQSAGDEADSQMEDMADGKGAIMAGEIYFGEFHAALTVHGHTERQTEDRGASARATLSGLCATVFVPATLSAPETFFSIFPGNTKRRPRPMPKTTRNWLGLFSMNTYSSGKQYGNPIGDGSAIMPLLTSVNGVYHYNFHYSMEGLDSRGEKVPGHTLIFGATGAGKTTLQTTLLSFLERFDNKLFAIDKDGSMRGFIEAQGGTYFRLENNVPTGLNPFQLPDTPQNRNFLYDLVSACARGNGQDTPASETKVIKNAVDNLMEQVDFEYRRFAVLLQSVPETPNEPNSLRQRLNQWAHTEDGAGRYAYALDNPANNFNWEDFKRVGFDVSDFLVKGHPATEPILSYLFHLKTLMQRSPGILATVVEEFWLPISYPTTAAQILDTLKTGRRRDEFIILVTQSPEDAFQSPLLPAILQQTPTKIYLANPDAKFRMPDGTGYHLLMSEKEFKKLIALGLRSYMFLIKQGAQSAIVKLDLSALTEYIAVLAMAQDDFKYLEQAKEEAGTHPDQWIPQYMELRAKGRVKIFEPIERSMA